MVRTSRSRGGERPECAARLVPACDRCPAGRVPGAVVAQHQGDGQWRLARNPPRVHLVALFRDPEIRDGRNVESVLDLWHVDGTLRHGRFCWTRAFVMALRSLPAGLTVALENGVRCPWGTARDPDGFARRVERCHASRLAWIAGLGSPAPPVVVCDRHVAENLGEQGVLTGSTGERWTPTGPFIDCVGTVVLYAGRPALILAHPEVVRRHPGRYVPVLESAVPALTRLAGF